MEMMGSLALSTGFSFGASTDEYSSWVPCGISVIWFWVQLFWETELLATKV